MRAAIVVALLATTAHADTPRDAPTELEVDRAETPAGRTEFGFDGGAAVDTWGVTLSGGWLEEPIVFGLSDGGLTYPVRRRQTCSLGGALALGTSIVVDARFALAHQVGDRLRSLGSTTPLDRFVPTDLRLGARIRVAGDGDRAVFVRGELSLPTGDQHDFAGEPSWSAAWRLIGRLRVPAAGLTLAASAGIRLRGEEVLVGDRLIGNELVGAAGVAIAIPPVCPLWCEYDQVKLTVELAGALGDDVGQGRGPSPLEARAGIASRVLPSLTLGARAGIGLVDELGAPAFRATVELTYQAPARAAEPAAATPPPAVDLPPPDPELIP
ncbi:MAG TPA: hypothetical protein VFQ53_39875 [Kofleriaceae bacterium]|nr:hypothetical protein [Kofleriaceae bacterium]